MHLLIMVLLMCPYIHKVTGPSQEMMKRIYNRLQHQATSHTSVCYKKVTLKMSSLFIREIRIDLARCYVIGGLLNKL